MIGALGGRLLVATPILEDPNFARSVVLLCSHRDDGAFGLVLNRPLTEPVARHLPEWGARAVAPSVFFAGGPVQRTVVMALGSSRSAVDASWWTPVLPGVGLIDLRQVPEGEVGATESVRLFVGYAGWGGGQLEAEIAEQAWFVLDAFPGDPFTSDPETLRGQVFRRQRGRTGHLALYANYPANARYN
jgi:putative transcriptional regulator